MEKQYFWILHWSKDTEMYIAHFDVASVKLYLSICDFL